MLRPDELLYEEAHAAQKRSGPVLLSEKQKQKNLELLSLLQDIIPIDDPYKVSDCDLLYRFLIGRQWSLEMAQMSLRTYAALRQKQDLNGIVAERFSKDVESSGALLYGFDREGFPIMWSTPDIPLVVTLLKDGFKGDLLRVQMQVMEKARFLAKERHVDRCTLVLDLRHTRISCVNSLSLSFARDLAKVMQEYYPEIMSRMLVFNAGWAVSGAWKVIKPLLDQRVQDKVHFFTGAPTMESILRFIDEDQVPPSHGGKCTRDVAGEMIQAEIDRINNSLPAKGSGRDPTEFATPLVESASSRENKNTLAPDAPAPMSVCLDPSLLVGEVGGNNGVASSYSEISQELETTDASMQTDTDDMELFSPYSSFSSLPEGVASPSMQIGSLEALNLFNDGVEDLESPLCIPQQQQQPIAPIILPGEKSFLFNITKHMNGTIEGFIDGVFIGKVEHNIVYVFRENRSDSSVPESPQVLQGTTLSAAEWVMVGELLNESGHPIHHHVIVCDARRCALFLLRKSRMHRCVQVLRLQGNAATVRTDNLTRHSVAGGRVKFAECVPHPTDGDSAAWVMNVTNQGEGEKQQDDNSSTSDGRNNNRCCAERTGTSLRACGVLAEMPPADVFTLLIGVCRMWEVDVWRNARRRLVGPVNTGLRRLWSLGAARCRKKQSQGKVGTE